MDPTPKASPVRKKRSKPRGKDRWIVNVATPDSDPGQTGYRLLTTANRSFSRRCTRINPLLKWSDASFSGKST
jgi:hypothetical protein